MLELEEMMMQISYDYMKSGYDIKSRTIDLALDKLRNHFSHIIDKDVDHGHNSG